MTKHNLRVDHLWELDPTHHGVNGCNIGQGQQILVRLRNETNADFCSIEEIMDTMLHELAHNHYPEHDRHFYSFWNTLRGEYEALRTSGYTDQEPVQGISFFRSRPQYRRLPSRSAFPLRSCRVRQIAPSVTTASSYARDHLPAVAPLGAIAAGIPYAPEGALQYMACPYPSHIQPLLVEATSFRPAPFTPYIGSHTYTPYSAVWNAAERTF